MSKARLNRLADRSVGLGSRCCCRSARRARRTDLQHVSTQSDRQNFVHRLHRKEAHGCFHFLGKIFDIGAKADALVADYRKRVAFVTDRTAKAAKKPRIMYCGGCNNDTPPRTIGTEGMPRLLFDLAGGQNIFDDIKDSYVNVSWDAVIARDPEWIVISNLRIPPEDSIRYLTTSTPLAHLSAVKNRNFLFMTYAERSPSTRNVDALERLARAIHPELF